MKDTPRPIGNSVSTIHEWLDWLAIKGRADIFKQFLQVLRIFVVIPVTSCSCERTNILLDQTLMVITGG